MKELKNRIKGLSAILLAVSLALCLVVRFSGVRASAEKVEQINIDYTSDGVATVTSAINNKTVTKKLYVSGGTFVLVGNNDIIRNNIIYDNGTSDTGTSDTGASDTASHYKAELSGTDYAGFMITNDSANGIEHTFTIQFVKEPEYVSDTAVRAIGVGTYYLTIGNGYSFSGTGTYKVKGDPTVYQFKEFCVPSDGTYTILQ